MFQLIPLNLYLEKKAYKSIKIKAKPIKLIPKYKLSRILIIYYYINKRKTPHQIEIIKTGTKYSQLFIAFFR